MAQRCFCCHPGRKGVASFSASRSDGDLCRQGEGHVDNQDVGGTTGDVARAGIKRTTEIRAYPVAANPKENDVMNASFYRAQAELCLRIGRTLPQERIAEELLELAAEYEAKAAVMESALSSTTNSTLAPSRRGRMTHWPCSFR
jgi:hypothetical protein